MWCKTTTVTKYDNVDLVDHVIDDDVIDHVMDNRVSQTSSLDFRSFLLSFILTSLTM